MSSISERRPSAKQNAYDHVRELVINTPLDEAAFLTEGEIAASLGISRTPVREAFLQLESERFLRLMPKKGAYIPVISEKEMEEVIETRAVLESYSARRLVEHSSDVIVRVREILEEQRKRSEQEDAQAFIDLDREFHLTLVKGVGNRTLADLYESLRDRQLRMGTIAVYSVPSRFEQVLAEHAAIVDAIEAGELDDVLAAVDTHLRTSLRVLLAAKRPQSWDARADETV